MTGRDQQQQALQSWDLEPVVSVTRAHGGTMNEIFIVTTADRKVVLRQHRRGERQQVDFEHAVINHAVSRGIPTPAAIPSRSGAPFVDHDGCYYSLFTFATGDQLEDDQLTADDCRAMGKMAARLHLALADYPIAAPKPGPESTDPAPLIEEINVLLDRIDRLDEPTEQDGWARDHLVSKAEWLRTHRLPTRADPPAELFQLVHGDYLHHNLFFSGGVVSDVIDWDKAESRLPADEIIRCFDHSLKMRPELCTAMINGYRATRPLTTDDLDQSALYWFARELRSVWLYDWIYLRGHDRLRVYLEPGGYLPFGDRWERLRPHLA